MPETVIDNFNRVDTVGGGTVGNGWVDTESAWSIVGNRANPVAGGLNLGTKQILRPANEAFADGKWRVKVTNGSYAVVLSIRNQVNGDCIGGYTFVGQQLAFFKRIGGNVTNGLGVVSGLTFPDSFILQLESVGSVLTLRGFLQDGTSIASATYDFTSDALSAGQWGISAAGTQIDEVSLFTTTTATALTITGAATANQNSGTSYTIGTNGTIGANVTVAVARSGVAGAVSPASVTLTPGAPTATVVYTPSGQGAGVITATATGLTAATLPVSVGVPALSVGFQGDSITFDNNVIPVVRGILEAYGNSSRPVVTTNRGVGGTTTNDCLPGSGAFTNNVTAFNAANVSVVNIAYGTNDCRSDKNVTKAQYKANIVAMIDAYFTQVPTLRGVAIEYPPSPTPNYLTAGVWANTATGGNTRLLEYHAAIGEIAALPAYAGKVFAGSKSGYERCSAVPEYLPDGIHPATTNAGATVLAISWAQGIAAAAGIAPVAGGGTVPTPAEYAAAVWAVTARTLTAPVALPTTPPAGYGGGTGAVTVRNVLRVGDYPQTSSISPVLLTEGDTVDIEVPLRGDFGEPIVLPDTASVSLMLRRVGFTGTIAPVAGTLTTPDVSGVRYARAALTAPAVGDYEATFAVAGVSYPLGRRIPVRVKGAL